MRLPRHLDLKHPLRKGTVKNLDSLEERMAWRLFLPLEGILELNDGVRAAPGDVLFLPQDWPFMTVKMPSEWLEFVLRGQRAIYRLGHKNGKIQELVIECHTTIAAHQELNEYFTEINKKPDPRDPSSRRIHGMLDLLLLRFIDFSDGTELRTYHKLKGRQRYTLAMTLIQSHLSSPLTSAQAARELNCSQQYLTRLIQRQRKMRFIELLNFCRLDGRS